MKSLDGGVWKTRIAEPKAQLRTALQWTKALRPRESFCLHGRNLYRFLLNRGDNTGFRALDFVDNYRPPKAGEVAAIIARLDAQVAHLGKRTRDPTEKVNIPRCAKLFNWIELHWPTFEAAIKPEYRSHWNPALADPSKLVATVSSSPCWPMPTTSATSIVYTSGPFHPVKPR